FVVRELHPLAAATIRRVDAAPAAVRLPCRRSGRTRVRRARSAARAGIARAATSASTITFVLAIATRLGIALAVVVEVGHQQAARTHADGLLDRLDFLAVLGRDERVGI